MLLFVMSVPTPRRSSDLECLAVVAFPSSLKDVGHRRIGDTILNRSDQPSGRESIGLAPLWGAFGPLLYIIRVEPGSPESGRSKPRSPVFADTVGTRTNCSKNQDRVGEMPLGRTDARHGLQAA